MCVKLQPKQTAEDRNKAQDDSNMRYSLSANFFNSMTILVQNHQLWDLLQLWKNGKSTWGVILDLPIYMNKIDIINVNINCKIYLTCY